MTAPPRPPLASPTRVRAERVGAKVRIRWQGDARRYDVRCGAKAKASAKTRTTVRSSARTCKVRSVGHGEASAWVKAPVRR